MGADDLEAALDPAALRIDDSWWPTDPGPGPFRLTVGARRLDPAHWLAPRPLDTGLLHWKRALLDEQGRAAFDVLPGAQAAATVALSLVSEVVAGTVGGRHPLDEAGRLVVEDLCLVDVSGPQPVLVGASLAMPNRWSLADKLGRPMSEVHGPVPGYADHIGPAVDRLLAGLRGDRVLARSNWAVTEDPRLFQPAGSSQARRGGTVRSPQDAASRLWVRTEYQTLRALPGTAGVLFTIRTAQEPLGALADRPRVAAGLAATIARLPAAELDYKGLLPHREPVLDLLWDLSGIQRD